MTVTNVQDVLKERKSTHGDYSEHAEITQRLKDVIHGYPNWLKLSHMQRESLHMVLHKIGRIMSGNPNVADHWIDMAGYSTLISNELENTKANGNGETI
jgi:hypothetical protein